MYSIRDDIRRELAAIDTAGTTKRERILQSPQDASVIVNGMSMLNFCANNYLGLANHPDIVRSAQRGMDAYGFGMASVRFICGTNDEHLALERELSDFLGTDGAVLYSSCFDANGAIFETLLGAEDAVISDALNHASIIDGIRLSKARRYRYANRDMAELERCLRDSADARRRLIVTDGVFSMDGYFAPLPEICDLADRYDAMVMVDDSHAVGFIGATGAGTPEKFGVQDRVDILSGTLGKALGGASGGYLAGHAEIMELLRQRSRPYLFSNSLAPAVASASRTALRLVREAGELRSRLERNTRRFKDAMAAAGFELLPGEHPITAVMLHDAHAAANLALRMLAQGVYVTAFSYPVVPEGRARIRVQLSAAHSDDDVDEAVNAFIEARGRG